ncbi:MAG: hypothetical protein HY000_38870 [Planctomycetes bacterium]|nr:hypothetical protein [Planctomycetota bacterium]
MSKVVDWQQLCKWRLAPDEPGFYEIGLMCGAVFAPKYGGRTSRSLRGRLSRHWQCSHNDKIREHRTEAWFRYQVLPAAWCAKFVEGLHLIAFQEEYVWNKRQEWKQHYAFLDEEEQP